MEIMNIKESLEFFNKMKEALDDGHESIKLAYVDTITVKNAITKKNMVMNDIYFLAGDNKTIIFFIRSIQDVKEQKLYKIHNDLEHVNISDNYETFTRKLTIDGVTSEYVFNVAPFCNPITGHSLYNNTDTYTKLLKGFLYQQNHSSRYRSPCFIDIEAVFHRFVSRNDETILPKQVTPVVAVARLKPDSISDPVRYLENLNEIASQMKDGDVFAYTNYIEGSTNEYRIVTQQQLEEYNERGFNARIRISKDYPIFTKDDLKNATVDIPLTEKDCLFIGLGSANSGIITYLGRSLYMGEQITLIDPDNIEEKNLRNQLYRALDTKRLKANAMRDIIKQMSTERREIDAHTKVFQEVPLAYRKYKYIFCGLDTIKTRQELLDQILKGNIKGDYLIDTRYFDQTSSIYFIDLNDKEQVDYYKYNLDADGDILSKEVAKKVPLSKERINQIIPEMLKNRCAYYATTLIRPNTEDKSEVGYGSNNLCSNPVGRGWSCGCAECRAFVQKSLEQVRIPEQSTCLKQNIIGIYNYTGAYVYQIIKTIEDYNKKVATHVELACETVPQAMVVRK